MTPLLQRILNSIRPETSNTLLPYRNAVSDTVHDRDKAGSIPLAETTEKPTPARVSNGRSVMLREQVPLPIRIASTVFVMCGLLALFGGLAYLLPDLDTPLGKQGIPSTLSTQLQYLPYYTLRSVLRMFIALLISLIFTFVYGLLAVRSRRAGMILIPLLDILQSVPILGFLSATITIWLVLFPNNILGVEAASIFAIFTSQAWNMTFSFIQSLESEPKELIEAAVSFRLTKWQRFWNLDVPYAMIPLLWNCMMSVGGGWFFLTASEMISVNNHNFVLPGIGSFVGISAQRHQLGNIGWAIAAIIIVVCLIDWILWKPLTAWAEKFRITQNNGQDVRTSVVLSAIRHSGLSDFLERMWSPISELLVRWTRIFGTTHIRIASNSTPTRKQTLGDVGLLIGTATVIAGGIYYFFTTINTTGATHQLWIALGLGTLTFARVALLVVVCSIIWVPIGVWIGMNPKISKLAQPLVQITASFPANFIFPIVTLWFVAWNININWGSIILMALGTQWYILFNVIAGASAIPDDLREMTRSFHLSKWQQWKHLILPAIFGAWCTGGITAAGGAWNASIVAEIVTYGHTTLQAQGLGAYIAQATEHGNTLHTIIGVAVMSMFVVGVNRFFWKPLQKLAQHRYSLM